MSRVCNIVILALAEKGREPIKNLNKWVAGDGHGALEEISSHCGGNKHLETDLYATACNYISDVDEFIKLFHEQDWEHPPGVVLLVKDQDDTKWTVETLAKREDRRRTYFLRDLDSIDEVKCCNCNSLLFRDMRVLNKCKCAAKSECRLHMNGFSECLEIAHYKGCITYTIG